MTRRESLSEAVLQGCKDLTKIDGENYSQAELTLIETLVERDGEKLSKALVQVWDKIQKLRSDLDKIQRPDHILYGPNREKLSESYTKGRLDEIEKLVKQIGKLENAMEKALTKDDRNDLYNLAGGKDVNEGGEDKGGDKGESEG